MTVFKFGKPILIFLLLIILGGPNMVLAKPRFVPTPDDSNSTDTTVLDYATRQFEEAMRRWEQGLYGALLFYHRTDGPLTSKFQVIIELDPDLPRRPVSHNTECIACDADGDCDAIANIKFNTESSAKLRIFHLPRAYNWGLYSEARLQGSPALRRAIASCKAGNRVSFEDYIEETDAVRLAFEKTMRAYRDEKWVDLLLLLAHGPRQTIKEQLNKPGGEKELLETGRLPVTWEFNCAVPTSSDFYYVYSWMSNRNQNGKLVPFRFKFTADPSSGMWQLAESQELLEGDYFKHHYGVCIQMQTGNKYSK